jgi:hypothetical protein
MNIIYSSSGLLAIVFSFTSIQVLAQQNEPPSALERLSYWLTEQTRVQAERITLEKQLIDLKEQIAADPNKSLRDSMAGAEAFIAKLEALRPDAEKIISPPLARSLEWAGHDAAERLTALKQDLATRERKTAENQRPLKRQIEDKQRDLDDLSRSERTIAEVIRTLREDRLRDNKVAEISDFANAVTRGVISPDAAPPASVQNPEKKKP